MQLQVCHLIIIFCSINLFADLSYQEHSRKDGEVEILLTVSGMDLIGALVNAPLSIYKQVYVLPMLTIDHSKVWLVLQSSEFILMFKLREQEL